MAADDLANRGFILNLHSAERGRTLIVTGLQRSGTSLVASVLRQAGVFMGSEINDAVVEDEAIARILEAGDIAALQQIVADRNANHRRWGFKYPMLCHVLGPGQVGLFDRPCVIAIVRDPVAMAVRASLSEYQEPMQALHAVVAQQAALLDFVGGLACPNLLLSYEKALTFPGDFVDVILHFCDITVDAAARARLLAVIEPNRPQYIATARRRFEGLIEGVRGRQLYGWCRLTASPDPVTLEVLVDDRVALSVIADTFRQDLRDAGVGAGSHGFFVGVETLQAGPDSVIRVRVTPHGIELGNSGTRLRDFGSSA